MSALEEQKLLATFTVTNTMNDGDGSLRWAIDQANMSTTPSLIVFEHDLFPTARTIDLDGRPLPTLGVGTQTTIEGRGENLLPIKCRCFASDNRALKSQA